MLKVAINLNKYRFIFLDFDGVICNSNIIKEKNIFLASKRFVNEKKALDFTKYFISNSGIPREEKIKYFWGNNILAQKILKEYESLNKNLLSAKLNIGLRQFLSIYSKKKFIILSGGNKKEIVNYLIKKKLLNYFEDILCGPLSKNEHLKKIGIHSYNPSILFGDSKYDYEISSKFGLDFIFMFGNTNFSRFLEELNKVIFTKNFKTLLEGKVYEKN